MMVAFVVLCFVVGVVLLFVVFFFLPSSALKYSFVQHAGYLLLLFKRHI